MPNRTPDFASKLSDVLGSSASDFFAEATILNTVPLPPPSISILNQNDAEWMYERVVQQIAKFEVDLSPQEEVGARLVSAPGEGTIHIDDVGYWGPDMIIFYGKNQHGRPVQLWQHLSQLSLLLTAIPVSTPPRRIGFNLQQRLSENKQHSD